MAEQEIDLMQAFMRVAPYLNDLINDDVAVAVYDTEKNLAYVPAKSFTLNTVPGDPLVRDDAMELAIRKNEKITMAVPKEFFGFPISARAIPLHDAHGKVVGSAGIGTSLEKANTLFQMAESFSEIVEQTATTVGNISEAIDKLSDRVQNITGSMQDVSMSANEIGKISAVVKGISDQSNLLGLNAAIEAARAGENGKGFAVVADEVRNLATNSKENADQINSITKNIQQLLATLNDAFSEINTLTNSQSEAITDFSSTIHEINGKAQHLAKFAEELL